MARINELYEKIAAQIRTQLAEGTLPWHKPWAVDPDRQVSKPLRENAVPYQGINVLILWGAAIEAGYASPFWMTYRQAQSLGAQVRRGEKATHIVFAKTAKKRETDEYGDETEVLLPVRRVYAVFNADQIDDVTAKYVPEVPDVTRSPPRNTARPPRRKRAFLPEPRTPRSTPRAPSCIMRFGSCPGHPAGTVRRTASIEASPSGPRIARPEWRGPRFAAPAATTLELFQCPRNAPSKIV